MSKDLAAMTPFEAASYWFVLQDSHGLTDDERRGLESWLAASDSHRRAYEQTRSMWNDFEESADEGELRSLHVAALAVEPSPKVWPRASAIAAAVLMAVGLATLAWDHSTREPSAESAVSHENVAQYMTAHNQRSTVTLPDGTLVSMNLDTSFQTDFSAARRIVHMSRGQAFFEVTKDRNRPFIVAAADRHIRALGTKFEVRLDPNRVEVVLLEGRVSVERSDSSLEGFMKRAEHVELEPGQRLVARSGEQPSITTTNAARATSWRDGWIVFEDETVEQAIAELNRYSNQPIVVSDDSVKTLRLSGVFRVGQPDRFAAIIQELLPVSAERGPAGETMLVLKPDSAGAAGHP